MISWVAIFIGGGIGSICRYAVSKVIMNLEGIMFPVATLLANVLSCAALAATLTYVIPKMEGNEWIRPLIVVGFCGGFSTFSTFSLETLQLLRAGNFFFAGLNLIISVVLCLATLNFILRYE